MSLAAYRQALDRLSADLPASEQTARSAQFAAFSVRGFPHKKLEDWRYTDLSALADKVYELAPPLAHDFSMQALAGCEVHGFVNGHGNVAGMSAAAPNAIAQLNAAFARSGYTLNVATGQTLEKPQQVLTWCDSDKPAMAHLHHRITLAENSRATVFMQHGGHGDYLGTQFTRIELAAGSRLTLVRVQDGSVHSHHLEQTEAQLARQPSRCGHGRSRCWAVAS